MSQCRFDGCEAELNVASRGRPPMWCSDHNHPSKRRPDRNHSTRGKAASAARWQAATVNRFECVCAQCGGDFICETRAHRGRKYCSHKCQVDSQVARIAAARAAARALDVRECPQCGDTFTPANSLRQKFCTQKCRQNASRDSSGETCSEAGCDRPLRARGLCSSHYNQAHQPNRHAPRLVQCAACGMDVMKMGGGGNARRPICSDRCRYKVTHGRWPGENKQLIGPMPATCQAQPPAAATEPALRFVGGTCLWCGATFLHDLRRSGVPSKHCSDRCTRKAVDARRDQRKGRFTVTRVLRSAIYERDQWTCQLCMLPVDNTLPPHHPWAATLDHIECQSWTLIPDHSPSNLRLAHRMCNSIRGDETYHHAG